jgi:tetratricopeptide (TPR) repeat protein
MGIWKWMKHASFSPLARSARCLSGAGRRLPACVLIALLAAAPLAAKPTFGFRIMPGYYIPVGDTLLKPGFGVSGTFDFFPVSYLGFFIDGEYVSIGLQNVSSIALSGGSFGASYAWSPKERWTLRADLMAGVYSVTQSDMTQSGLSAGARLSADYQINPVVSAEVHTGVKHYAYRPDPFMTAVEAGVGVSVNLTEAFAGKANVSAVTEKQDPVFPVFYSWYDDNPMAMVKVTNNEPNTITDITTSFYCEQYMGQPKLCTTTRSLAPGESCEVPVKAFFNESMLSLTEKDDAEAKIIVEYRKLGSKRRAEIPMTIPVYDRNSMNWDDDRRAAAFVSSKDPAALWFSKYVSSVVSKRFRPGVNNNIQYAIGIFESLKTYGLSYVVDPSSAYGSAGSGVDFLQYPYQTLMYRGGDCDDLSILYCSLLEAINVDAAFITVPGHIYIAFSTGMTEEEAKKSCYLSSQFAYHEGKAWVPLEITLTKENFNKAWKTGAKEWNDCNARGTARLYPIKEAWQVYRPISVPGAASRFSLPSEQDSAVAFDASLDAYIERELKPQIRAYDDALAKNDTPELRNRFGVLYGRYGLRDEAKEQFSIAAHEGCTDAWVNLGNVAFQEENYSGALKYYNYVLAVDPENSVALLGSARAYYELEEFRYSDALYAELGTRDYALSRQYTYLASFFDNTGRAWNLSDRLSTTTWSVSDDAPLLMPDSRVEDESSDPVDADAFLASLAQTAGTEPDIASIDKSFAETKKVAKRAALEPPSNIRGKRKNTVPTKPASPMGGDAPVIGLTASLTVVRDESDEAAAKTEVERILKSGKTTPPELPKANSGPVLAILPVQMKQVSEPAEGEPSQTDVAPAKAITPAQTVALAEESVGASSDIASPAVAAPLAAAFPATESAQPVSSASPEKKPFQNILLIAAVSLASLIALASLIRRKLKKSGGKK